MAERPRSGVLTTYRLVGTVAAPLVPSFLAWRARRGKEDASRVGERRGITRIRRPKGGLVWVHAASVGETNAVLPLVKRLTAAGVKVLFTTVTLTSAGIAAARLPAGSVHQFGPVDVPPWVERFLDYWRPNLALFVESELWPATMSALAVRDVPQILVNARLSERSFRRWRFLGPLVKPLFSEVTLCLAQSPDDAKRYGAIGVGRVEVTGNLKFDAALPDPDETVLADLRAMIGERPVWLAASTHEGEELIAGRAHIALKANHARLLSIIVPRHPDRGRAIADALTLAGLRVALRSEGKAVMGETDIYVADTLGELGLFYRISPIAFMGGSLVLHGGQNPIEPARFEAAILHGPHVQNFADIYAALDESGAELVADQFELTAAVGRLLADPARARNRARAATAALLPYTGALERTLAAIRPYLEPLLPMSMPQ